MLFSCMCYDKGAVWACEFKHVQTSILKVFIKKEREKNPNDIYPTVIQFLANE